MSSHSKATTPTVAPETVANTGVFWGNVFTLLAFFIFFSFFFSAEWSAIWTGITLAGLIMSGGIAVGMADWHGAQYFNNITKKRRAIFPGFHFKLLWESREGEIISLRKEIAEEVPVQFTTNDPAEGMDVKLLVLIKPDISGTKEEASEKLIRWNSIPDHDLKHLVTTEVIKMFGEYYGEKEMEELTKLHKVQNAVWKNPDCVQKIADLQERYGAHIDAVLKSSVPDEKTKETKRTVGRAEAFRDARQKLIDAGMDPEEAGRKASLLDPNTDYTEHRADWNANLKVEGLENLQTMILGQPNLDPKKKGSSKK